MEDAIGEDEIEEYNEVGKGEEWKRKDSNEARLKEGRKLKKKRSEDNSEEEEIKILWKNHKKVGNKTK